VCAVSAATASAASHTGSVTTSAAGTARTGESVAGTFTITGFKRVNGVLTAVGTFAGTVDGVSTRLQDQKISERYCKTRSIPIAS
jgi:hypothetical protein